jgi:hypothetical protein
MVSWKNICSYELLLTHVINYTGRLNEMYQLGLFGKVQTYLKNAETCQFCHPHFRKRELNDINNFQTFQTLYHNPLILLRFM